MMNTIKKIIARIFIIFFNNLYSSREWYIHMKEFISQIFTKLVKCSSVQAKSFAIYLQCNVSPPQWAPRHPTYPSTSSCVVEKEHWLSVCVFLFPKTSDFIDLVKGRAIPVPYQHKKNISTHRNVSIWKYHVEMIVCGNLFVSVTHAHWCLWVTNLIAVGDWC